MNPSAAPWYARTRELTHALVRQASVTESAGEVGFAAFLQVLLAGWPYFQRHPAQVWCQPIQGDPFGRSNLYALVRGRGRQTVLLTGHYDVVSVDNYGPLEALAFDPETLLPALITDLKVNARSEAEQRALRDLESGLFEPGRGMADMKSGLAAGLVVLEAFSRLPQPEGNLLFVAVPDEENNSWGARGAGPQLQVLQERLGLEVGTVLNLDATADDGEYFEGQAIYTGSVGKLLISAYVVGIDTHASYPLDGINPNFLLSQVVGHLECNPTLADTAFGETAPPPATLKQTDLKTHYDVTTPGRAWACFNVLSHGKSASQTLGEFRREIQGVLTQAIQTLRQRARVLGKTPSALQGQEVEPYTLSFAELYQAAQAKLGQRFEAEYQAFANGLEATLNLPTRSQRLTDWLWSKSERIGPAVVVGFASQPYPAVRTPPTNQALQQVRATLEAARAERNLTIKERGFFAGISDMSWFGEAPALDLETINRNTPVVSAHLAAAPLGLPTFNLGPWGRDYHQWLERVYTPYAYSQLPELLWRVTRALLERRS